jgi:hypothetical protein
MGTTNVYRAWGTSARIGSDPYAELARTFGGYISSVAFFSNALNVGQIENLFAAGEASGNQAPIMVANPSPLYQVLGGLPLSISATAYGGTNCNGYWQTNSGSGWFALTNSSAISGATNTVTNGLNQVAILVISNVTAANSCSYRLVVTNSWNGLPVNTIYSSTAVIQIASAPAASSYAGVVVSPGYNAVSYWPLNETTDPSTTQVTAFDIVGGFNGYYGYLAQDGGPNAALAGNAGYVAPVQGPARAGYTGLPATAYANINSYNVNTVITVPASAAMPTNNTNMSIVLWFYVNPTATAGLNAYPNVYCDLLMEVGGYLGAGGNGGIQLNLNSATVSGAAGGNLQVAYDWDNDLAAAHQWISGMNVPANLWTMCALIISPSNAVEYMGNTSVGLLVGTNALANINMPWGGGFCIGGNPAGYPGSAANPNGTGNYFNGSISSVAMFATNLSALQIEGLFDAGIASGTNMPVLSANPPFPNYTLLTNGSATILATGYTGPGGGSFWQKNTGSGWTTLTASGHHPVINVFPQGTLLASALTLTNVDGTDAGSYQCVFTNAGSEMKNGVRAISSAVRVTTIPNPPTNTFEAVALTPSYGLTAFWPLDDIGDVTTNLPAYDVWGGWNGYYGTNALDGASSPISGLPGAWGPGMFGLKGFPLDQLDPFLGTPLDGALGSTSNGIASRVNTAASPTFATNNTNMTIVAWIYPFLPVETQGSGLVFTRSASQVDGLIYGASDSLGDVWNNANGGYSSYLSPPTSNWSMVAMVNTASNTTLYVCTTNGGIQAVPQVISNAWQAWGQGLTIGGDPGTDPGLSFNGNISSVAMFSNALSPSQIGYLYAAGVGLGVLTPIIGTQPSSTAVYSGRPATFTVVASGVGAVTYQWQYSTVPNIWNNVSGATNATYVLTNPSSGTQYRVIVTDQGISGSASTTSQAVTVTVSSASGLSGYAQAVTNLNPLAYYQLNEAVRATNAFDYWGGFTGTYEGAVTAGVPGPTPTVFPLGFFAANNTAAEFTNAFVQAQWLNTPAEYNSQVVIPALNINSNAMTITMWINPNEAQAYTNGLLYCRGAGTTSGLGFSTNKNTGSLGYNWNNSAAQYNWDSGLIPPSGQWSFVAMIVTPTNTSLFCYNAASQNSALNSVTNAVQLWSSPATLGDDFYSATGARQFDGIIDEVAIFNRALDPTNINNLFTTGTGIKIPAVIQTPLSGQTNFVNAGTVSFTVGAVNGPLFYQWTINGIVITNGSDGYPGVVFSGAGTNGAVLGTFGGASNTLSISNYSASLAGRALQVSVTNLAVSTPATSSTTLPKLFPTPALWTADFSLSNSVGWGGATGTTTGYQGYGIIGLGTSWNQFGGVAAGYNGILTNYSAHDDTGLIADTGVRMVVTVANVYESPTPWDSTLFDPFLVMPVGSPTTTPVTDIVVTNLTPGFYNLFLFSLNGSWGYRGTSFIVDSTTNSANNGGVVQTVDQAPFLGTNTVAFTNVLTLTGTISVATMPSTPATGVNFGSSGNVAGESDFNGMQIQFISPFQDLAVTQTGTRATLTWAGGILVSGPTVNGPWTPVTVSGGGAATSPYQVPGVAAGSAVFYRMQEGVVPGLGVE